MQLGAVMLMKIWNLRRMSALHLSAISLVLMITGKVMMGLLEWARIAKMTKMVEQSRYLLASTTLVAHRGQESMARFWSKSL